MNRFLCGLLLVLCVFPLFAAEGNFDPTFGDGGRLLVGVSAYGKNDSLGALVLRSNGKLLLGGQCVYVNPQNDGYTFCLTQLNADGSYDQSFGPSQTGYLEFDHFPGWSTSVIALTDMLVLKDGRIALLGNSEATATIGSFVLAILLPDGSALDSTAGGGNGYLQLKFAGSSSTAQRMVQQADGKIVIAGYAVGPSGNSDFAAARVLSDFSGVDPQFGSTGSKLVAFDLGGPSGENTDECMGVALQSDGSLVLAGGSVVSSSPVAVDISLARLTKDGLLDTTFGSDGNGRLHYAAGYAVAVARAMQTDSADRIVIAANATSNANSTTNVWLIDRLTPDGGRDASFNQGNPQTLSQAPGYGGSPSRLALTNDGIFAIGATPRVIGGATDYFAVARLNLNGSLDSRFGNNGLLYGSFTATRDVDTTGSAIAVGNGGVMVAGTQTQSIVGDSANSYSFAIARLQYDQIFSYGFE